jgi:HlyD family secretion protein
MKLFTLVGYTKLFYMKNISLVLLVTILGISSCRNDNKKSFAFGNFESEEIIVSAEVSGTLKEFNVTEGMNLSAGKVVGYIDTTQLYLKKVQLEKGIKTVLSRVEQVNEQLNVNEVSLKNLIREKNRVETLLKDGAATVKQLDDFNGQLDLLNAQTNVFQSQKASIKTEIGSLQVQIDQVGDQLSKSYIKSPINGVVLEKYLFAGELAVPGKSLLKIANLNDLILRVFVSGDQLILVKIGNKVDVMVDAENGNVKKYSGIVTWVSSTAEFTPKIIQTKKERVNLVYAVKISVPNDGGLKIGMPAEIQVAL